MDEKEVRAIFSRVIEEQNGMAMLAAELAKAGRANRRPAKKRPGRPHQLERLLRTGCRAAILPKWYIARCEELLIGRMEEIQRGQPKSGLPVIALKVIGEEDIDGHS